jgi:hypothetical protein
MCGGQDARVDATQMKRCRAVRVGKNIVETARAQTKKYENSCTSPMNLAFSVQAPAFMASICSEQCRRNSAEF